MCIQYLHIVCKLGGWLVDCFFSILECGKNGEFLAAVEGVE